MCQFINFAENNYQNYQISSCIRNVLYQNRSPQAGKRENWQFVDLSRLQFTSDESEFIPDYI